MAILGQIDKENLHHAYLIEGARDEILPEVLELAESLGVSTLGNPDFCQIALDSFKIADARALRAMGSEAGFSDGKKIFVISANNILPEAQNTLLKIFEDPTYNTHFFVILPDADTLLPTLRSRFFIIKSGMNLEIEITQAEKFIYLSPVRRIDFLKDLMAVNDEDENNEAALARDGIRSKLIKFLNALEVVLHNIYLSKSLFDTEAFEQIWKAREYLRQPGSSAKSLMESVALSIPNL